MPRVSTFLVAGFLTFAYVFTGTWDFQDKLSAAEERKVKSETAPIWSQRCTRQGKDVLAVRADKGPWEIRCIQKRTVKA